MPAGEMTTWLPLAALVLLVGSGAVGIAMFLRAILTLPLDEKDER